MLWNKGMEHALHYLDDFFMIFSKGTDPALYNAQFNDLCKKLKISVNLTKDRIGTTNDFLRIELDIELMEIQLPSEKLQ